MFGDSTRSNIEFHQSARISAMSDTLSNFETSIHQARRSEYFRDIPRRGLKLTIHGAPKWSIVIFYRENIGLGLEDLRYFSVHLPSEDKILVFHQGHGAKVNVGNFRGIISGISLLGS